MGPSIEGTNADDEPSVKEENGRTGEARHIRKRCVRLRTPNASTTWVKLDLDTQTARWYVVWPTGRSQDWTNSLTRCSGSA